MTNFRPSASQALQKAFKRGRLQKVGTNYRLNPDWSGGSTSKRTNRRPQKMDEDSSALIVTQSSSGAGPSQWKPPTSLPFPYGPSQSQSTNPYQSVSRAAAASSRIPTSQIRPASNEDDQEEGIGAHREEGPLANVQFSVPKRPPDNFSLRQNLRTLARLLRESTVKQEA